jgi:hypothetical protein
MGLTLKKYGDWSKAGIVLQALGDNLSPSYKAQMKEDGEFILDTLRGHIDSQDLNWTPLNEETITMKGGDSTIYVEKGYLYDNLSVRKVKSAKNGVSFFIGASAWKIHEPSGMKLSDIMIWLEYGTDKIPARPLIRPTWEDIEPILKDHWEDLLKEMIEVGGKAT